MIPIHHLLSRIRWDPEFGRGEFALGYCDRVIGGMVRVPFSAIIFPPGRSDVLQVHDREGIIHVIPLHRIREVYRDNELIWQRG